MTFIIISTILTVIIIIISKIKTNFLFFPPNWFPGIIFSRMPSTGKYSQTAKSPFHEHFWYGQKKKISDEESWYPSFTWSFGTKTIRNTKKALSWILLADKSFRLLSLGYPLLYFSKKIALHKQAPKISRNDRKFQKYKRAILLSFRYSDAARRRVFDICWWYSPELYRSFPARKTSSVVFEVFSGC